MIKNLLGELPRRSPGNWLLSKRWLSVAMLIFLLLGGSINSKAGNISPEYKFDGEHFSVKWDSNRGAYLFIIRTFDYSYDDNWINDFKIYATVGSEKKAIFGLDSYWQKFEDHNGNVGAVYVYIKNYLKEDYARLCLSDKFSGWQNINYNPNSQKGNQYLISRSHDEANHVYLYWYPNTPYINKNITFSLTGLVITSKEHVHNKNVTHDPIKSSVYDYNVTVSNSKLNENTGDCEFDVAVSNLYRYSETNSKVVVQTSLNESDWVDRKIIYLSSSKSKESVADASLLKYKDKNNQVLLSAQEWTNGVYIRVKSFTNPDGMGDGSGNSPYLQEKTSSTMFMGNISSMESTNFLTTQNSRTIQLKWDVNLPAQDPDKSPYVIEKLTESIWEKIATIEHVDNKTSYNYNYELSDKECNLGTVPYSFRVRKVKFAKDNLWEEFMNSTSTTSIKTNYNTLSVTEVSTETQSTVAVVSWKRDQIDGIWDKEATVRLFMDGKLIASPSYSDSKCNVTIPQGCQTYKFRIDVTALGKTTESEIFSFYMPDNKEREISSFEASKGYYNNNVLLTWKVPAEKSNFTYFAITRTPVNGGTPITIQQITHTGLTDYSFQDKSMDAGILYNYVITGYSECLSDPDENNESTSSYATGYMMSDIGYSQPYGTISGRIAYDGSQGVSGVTVSVVGNDDNSKNKSLYFNENESESYLDLPGDVIDVSDDKEFTFQAWISRESMADDYNIIFEKNDLVKLGVNNIYNGNKSYVEIDFMGNTKTTTTTLNSGQWVHISLSVKIDTQNSSATCVLYKNGNKAYTGVFDNIDLNHAIFKKSQLTSPNNKVRLGKDISGKSSFGGYIDEIRFWSKSLDATEIKNNYDAFISGKENNLTGYYRCDEYGVEKVFDISGKGSVFNKRNGVLGRLAKHSEHAPSSTQLSNKTTTDEDGNYLINTVPYTTDGLQYNIIPTLGTHKFNPSKRPVFVSTSSSTFNSIDYVDESSFTVSGNVYYEGSLYPVEGVSFYVDGVICSKNGEVITSREDGSYEISVPIGDHFIQARKTGHEFVDNGRYPADANNIKVNTFTNDLKNMYFYDNTLVTVAGRVTGGNVEFEKPLGMALSENNLGKAKIELTAGIYQMNVVSQTKNGVLSFLPNNSVKKLESPTKDVNSTAYISGGKTIDDTKTIVVVTDSLTGEFAVKLPPIEYTVKSVDIVNNSDVKFDAGNISKIDATNVQMINTDSIILDNGNSKEFQYVASMKLKHLSEPVFKVSDMSNNDDAFGESKLSYQDITMDEPERIDAYVVENDKVKYLVSSQNGTPSPVFLQNSCYNFKIEAYEEYVNKDNKDVVKKSKVALDGIVITITNSMSASQKVYVESGTNESGASVKAGDLVELEENQLELDSLGTGVYTWRAGFPNIVAPYQRGLNIVYNYNGAIKSWSENSSFAGVVLGNLPSGNNFVTSGPDKVLMVLRDPPGTNSSAFWEEGVTLTTEEMDGGSIITNNEVTTTTSVGLYGTTIAGTPGFGVINEVGQKTDIKIGAEINANYSGSKTWTTTVTTTKNISTSDGFDFVGAQGDLFIGSATNIIFGNARQIGLVKKDGQYSIELEDVITTGSEFSTSFNYTTNFIENSLIPNLFLNRDALLKEVTKDVYNNYINTGDEVVYLTLLKKDNVKFGSRNFDKSVWGKDANTNKSATEGPSYKMVLPQSRDPKIAYQDMVLWYNEQITGWENTLADNEEAKYNAIENRNKWLDQNYSFDSGATIESSTTNCSGESSSHEREVETLVVLGLDTGFEINKTGIAVSALTKTGAKYFGNTTNSSETCITTGYTLKEEGDDDALTVDVYQAPDGFGAIFRTRGGQTSCPFEGEVVSKYFKPGYILSESTMQIEIPQISVVDSYATDVPAGKAATFTVKLENISEIDEDSWFDLALVDESNPNGAALSMDGAALTAGRSILVRAGETLTKTLLLKQSRPDIMDYENIKVVLKSQCQADPTGTHDVIADTISLSAYFVPSCTDITLEIDNRVMNTYTSDTLDIRIKDYDKTFNNLKAIRLQYKGERDIEWSLVKEYVLSKSDLTNNNELLPDGGRLTYSFAMSNKALYPDQTYSFRAVTACMNGNEEIRNESNQINVIKDMAKPLVMGRPTPSNGIISDDNEVSITFNETIKGASLTKLENFSVEGRLNGYKIDHSVAMKLQGEAAYTQADIDLSNKDFSIDMWIKVSSAGEIISHGNGQSKFVISTDADGNIIATIGNKEYSSTNKIPMNKWVFLYMSYENNDKEATLTSYIAMDASEKALFKYINVEKYNGNGRLKIGNGLKGAMHELTLWKKARSFVDAQSQMYVSKSATSPNLIGCWSMEEGRGLVAKDKARSRHLTIASANSWHIEADNYAASLNGSQYIAINTSLCPASTNEDCVIEMWFRAELNDGVSTLFSVNDSALCVRLNKNGNAELVVDGTVYATVNNNYADNTWHQLAMNIQRNGNAILYIDGTSVKQISGSLVPAVATDKIILGARRYRVENSNKSAYADYLKGGIDEFRLWKARLTSDMISENIYNRLSGSEAGLVAYYPFETKGLDSGNQVVVSSSFEDKSEGKAGNAEYTTGVKLQKDAPALKENITMTAVDFSFVASDNKIIIDINESEDRIEGTTLFFTVKDVRDENNNLSLPTTWSAYVSKNNLKWKDESVSIKAETLVGSTFDVVISNNGGETESWSLSSLPSWLKASDISGSLRPLSEKTIKFTVDQYAAIGKYEETIYLAGNKNINEPFTISLSVTGERPDWSVNAADYELTSNVIGQVFIDNLISEDEDDLVAAFINDVCVGVASPKYYDIYDTYYTMIDLYGNLSSINENIEFRIWDASTGNIYPIVKVSQKITFTDNTIYGEFAEPLILNAKDMIEQRVNLNKGWNWTSIHIKDEDDMSVNNIYGNILPFAEIIKGKSSFAVPSSDMWNGSLETVAVGNMYKVKTCQSDQLRAIGKSVLPSESPVSIQNGWNWIGYTPSYSMSLNNALAGLDPQAGDVVKGHKGFASYNGYTWVGPLGGMQPGSGYLYKSSSDKDKVFTFPNSAPRNARSKDGYMISMVSYESETFKVTADNKYSSNMTMICIVNDNNEIQKDVEVAVFSDDECRGAIKSTPDGLLFLTVSGDGNNDKLSFKVKNNGVIKSINQNLEYSDDAMLGSIDSPYIINLSPSSLDKLSSGIDIYPTKTNDYVNVIINGIEISLIEIIDLSGVKIYDTNPSANNISLDMRHYEEGVYFINILEPNGKKSIYKIVKY